MAIIPKRLVDGSQIAASATTYYTATNVKTRIDALSLTNTAATAINVTIYLVPSGGSASDSNIVLDARSVPAGGTYIPPGVIGQWIEAGGTLRAFASSATSVTLVASGVEYS